MEVFLKKKRGKNQRYDTSCRNMFLSLHILKS